MPPPENRLVQYLYGQYDKPRTLPYQVAETLSAMAGFPGAGLFMCAWDKNRPKDTTWWYEGTIRAVIVRHISDWLRQYGNDEYLLLTEQKYPPPANELKERADVTIWTRGGQYIFVELKADFAINSAKDDAYKLRQIQAKLKGAYLWGVMLYSIYNNLKVIESWQTQLQHELDDAGTPAPLVRR